MIFLTEGWGVHELLIYIATLSRVFGTLHPKSPRVGALGPYDFRSSV